MLIKKIQLSPQIFFRFPIEIDILSEKITFVHFLKEYLCIAFSRLLLYFYIPQTVAVWILTFFSLCMNFKQKYCS